MDIKKKYADMVIALFGSRLGTPTARATSGTIEEIEEMIKAGNRNQSQLEQTAPTTNAADPERYSLLK